VVEEVETFAYETLLRLVTLLHVKQIFSFSEHLLSLRRNKNRKTYVLPLDLSWIIREVFSLTPTAPLKMH